MTNVSQAFASTDQLNDLQTDVDTAIVSGFDYLISQMNDDGGIRWIDHNSSVATTIRVVLALAAAQYPQDFLVSRRRKTTY